MRPYLGPHQLQSTSSGDVEPSAITSAPTIEDTEDNDGEEQESNCDQVNQAVQPQDNQELPACNKRTKNTREEHIDQGNVLPSRLRSGNSKP